MRQGCGRCNDKNCSLVSCSTLTRNYKQMKNSNNIDDLIPENDEYCPCSSGKLFGVCCGADNTQPPRGVVIKHNAIPAKKCNEIVAYLKNQDKFWLTTYVKTNILGQTKSVNDPSRVAQWIKKGKWSKKIDRIVQQGFTEIIKDRRNQTLLWYEDPTVLFYTAGGLYVPHVDCGNFNSTTGCWEKLIDRDYSILFYLSDDFEGGNIHFNLFKFSYKPKKGDMIFFPSDSRYIHTAEPVLSGNRYAIVSWCAIKESTKVDSVPPDKAVHVKDA